MKRRENKKLIKELMKRIKTTTGQDIMLKYDPIHKNRSALSKYVSLENYKELVAFYKYLKEKEDVDFELLDFVLEENKLKVPYLHKCNNSIYEFAQTLKCMGPEYIANEMTRQGKEIDYINREIIKPED